MKRFVELPPEPGCAGIPPALLPSRSARVELPEVRAVRARSPRLKPVSASTLTIVVHLARAEAALGNAPTP